MAELDTEFDIDLDTELNTGSSSRKKFLNVAENSNSAKSMAKILSKDNYNEANGVLNFNMKIKGIDVNMAFTSVNGHLYKLIFKEIKTHNPRENPYNWSDYDPQSLFKAETKHVVQGKHNKQIKKLLEKEAEDSCHLILWLDNDREGENIAFQVLTICKAANENLKISRARFSSITNAEIESAFQSLEDDLNHAPSDDVNHAHSNDLNQALSHAVDVRQEIDLRVGAAFSRFQTIELKRAFNINVNADPSPVLSFGLSQLPTLGFVVQRYWQIQQHEGQSFWKIHCSYTTNEEGTTNFSWMRGRVFDHKCALIFYEMCAEECEATVTNNNKIDKVLDPPLPLTTFELHKLASIYLRMSPETTMDIANTLYQSGYISYPRTETSVFSNGIDLENLVRQQANHLKWGTYVDHLINTESWKNVARGDHGDGAHHPIHPTKLANLDGEPGWTQDHKALYELVCAHFLACVSPKVNIQETTIEITMGLERFSTHCNTIVNQPSYFDVYEQFQSYSVSQIPNLEMFNKNAQIRPVLTLVHGVTKPPKLLMEHDLLECMDKAGIGTDATWHRHITKLEKRGYITRDEGWVKPTRLGLALVAGYQQMGLTEKLWLPSLRQEMEKDLKEVGLKKMTKEIVLSKYLNKMETCFVDVRLKKPQLFEAFGNFFTRKDGTGARYPYYGGGQVEQSAIVDVLSNIADDVRNVSDKLRSVEMVMESQQGDVRNVSDKLLSVENTVKNMSKKLEALHPSQ